MSRDRPVGTVLVGLVHRRPAAADDLRRHRHPAVPARPLRRPAAARPTSARDDRTHAAAQQQALHARRVARIADDLARDHDDRFSLDEVLAVHRGSHAPRYDR